jgi:hypothetical protein
MTFEIDPLIALGVVLATATTDAAYVFFNAAVVLLCHKLTGRGIVGSAIIRRARDEPSYPIGDARGAVCRVC